MSTSPNKSKAWKQPKEVARMYSKDKLTLRAIGDEFGCSKETIRAILKSLDVPRDGKKGRAPIKRTYDTKEIRRLYVEEDLPMGLISKRLQISRVAVSEVLRSMGVEIKMGGTRFITYPELGKLKIGESLDLPRMKSGAKWAYTRYYTMAANVGIRVSVRVISDDQVRVTRKA